MYVRTNTDSLVSIACAVCWTCCCTRIYIHIYMHSSRVYIHVHIPIWRATYVHTNTDSLVNTAFGVLDLLFYTHILTYICTYITRVYSCICTNLKCYLYAYKYRLSGKHCVQCICLVPQHAYTYIYMYIYHTCTNMYICIYQFEVLHLCNYINRCW